MSTASHLAHVARVEPAALDQVVVALQPGALDMAHTRAGQYCRVGVSGTDERGYFVLIDPPGSGPARFLVRGGSGGAADILLTAAPGAEVAVAGPLGTGFPVEQAHGRDVLLVSAGSGLAAIRPLLLALPRMPTRRVWLYHGARTLAHVPFREDLTHAAEQGAQVVLALSREAAPERNSMPRVQDAIALDRPDLENAVVFTAGMDAMVDSLRELLPTLGLPPERVFTNY